VQKHDPILEFTQVTPSARIATLTHGWRAKCLQRLVRLDLPVPESLSLCRLRHRAVHRGRAHGVDAVTGILDACSATAPLISVRPKPGQPRLGRACHRS
jgi:pyruvate, orthophosphate dikinase